MEPSIKYFNEANKDDGKGWEGWVPICHGHATMIAATACQDQTSQCIVSGFHAAVKMTGNTNTQLLTKLEFRIVKVTITEEIVGEAEAFTLTPPAPKAETP